MPQIPRHTAMALWYPCVSDAFRAGVDERLTAWVFGAQSVILKSGFDVAFELAGGDVGSPEYINCLQALNSQVTEIEVDDFLVAFIETPQSTLTAAQTDWLNLQSGIYPCLFSESNFLP